MSLTPIHKAWRMLPPGARRTLFTKASALLAPRPDWPPPPVMPGVGVGGEIGRASGLGMGARLMAEALDRKDVPVWRFPCGVPLPGQERDCAACLPPAGVPLVLHVNSPMLPAALLRLPRAALKGRRIIGYWAWELPVAAPNWRAGTRFVHEVWVPSRFTAAVLEPLLPGRIRVVPHPLAAAPPRPSALARSDFGLPEEAVVVLVSFSLASSFVRKNPLAAISAFRLAFGERTDRVLVLKVTHAAHAPADMALLREAAGDAGNIRIETRVLPEADSHALTQAADIVLSLHRSEGFGLVPAEAMVLGKPVIATDYSGTADFLDATCGMPVPYRLVLARDPRGVFEAPGAMWAEADQGAAVDALRKLAADADLRARLGEAARRQALARLGAGPLMAALDALQTKSAAGRAQRSAESGEADIGDSSSHPGAARSR